VLLLLLLLLLLCVYGKGCDIVGDAVECEWNVILLERNGLRHGQFPLTHINTTTTATTATTAGAVDGDGVVVGGAVVQMCWNTKTDLLAIAAQTQTQNHHNNNSNNSSSNSSNSSNSNSSNSNSSNSNGDVGSDCRVCDCCYCYCICCCCCCCRSVVCVAVMAQEQLALVPQTANTISASTANHKHHIRSHSPVQTQSPHNINNSISNCYC